MGGEGVTQRVRMQIPIHIYEAHVFFYDAADGTLGKTAPGVIQKNGCAVRSGEAAGVAAGSLQEQCFAQRPIFIERLLGFSAVGDDAFLVAFAADAEDALFLLDVDEIESGKRADA
jgi:hypothetical protein